MADGKTQYFQLTLIEVGTSRDSWGQKTNDNLGLIDLTLKNLADRVNGGQNVPGAGVVPHFAAPGITSGLIYISAASGQDPTSKPGDLWLGF